MGSRLSALVAETKTVGKDKPKVSSTTYDINNLNQYEGVKSERNKAESYMYDKNGNLIQDDSQKYSYDYRNRLIEVKKVKENELVAKYSYDVLGRRLSKETKEQVRKYIYSSNDAIQEYQYAKKDGKLELTETKENIYSNNIDDIIATVAEKYEDGKIKETKTYYYHKNQLGSITAITDESGKTIEEYRYDAFGQAYLRNGKSDNWREFSESKTGNTRLFTGREYDSEMNLYYYRARYYSTSLGRFISRDPIGTRDDVNLYGYVGNRVVGYVDPMGMEKSILAFRETMGMYRILLAQSDLGKSSNCSFYGGYRNAKMSSTECNFYKENFGPFDLNIAKGNQGLSEKNTTYLDAVDSIVSTRVYQDILAAGISDEQMLNKFGWNAGNNTVADAIRHTYWNALNAKDFGVETAKKMGDYHEMLDDNLGHTSIMDLYNNSIGRSIGYENRDKTDEEILSIIVNNENKLIYGEGGFDGYWQGNALYKDIIGKLQPNLGIIN